LRLLYIAERRCKRYLAILAGVRSVVGFRTTTNMKIIDLAPSAGYNRISRHGNAIACAMFGSDQPRLDAE
jgi:hypothetical protein